MVDIHSHICYGVDDGSRSLEESVAMLEIAIAGGTTDIVATPHSDLKFHFQPKNRIVQLQFLCDAVQLIIVKGTCSY